MKAPHSIITEGDEAPIPSVNRTGPVSDSSQSTGNYYRIGLIGSKASGKTCLLAALNMQMRVNPRGYHAVMPALCGGESDSLRAGYEWIKGACESLRNGRWPDPNSNNHEARRLSVRFQFSDGATRKKPVELFDYSGELLNPETSQSELAAHLRDLLHEMDALMVLAEIPLPGRDSSELNETLNGLLSVFALLVAQRKEKPDRAARQIPIALVVNKWDRSGNLNGENELELQHRLLKEFLTSEPPPFHQNMMNALLPAAGDGRLKAFPVSACAAISDASERGAKERPQAGGQLESFGVQDPFLWLIEQRDDLDLKLAKDQIAELSGKWLEPPWSPWRKLKILKSKCVRFEKQTPEGKRLGFLVKDARRLVFRQIFVYLFLVLLIEASWDLRGHRNALSDIELPTRNFGWQQGTAWLRDYGQTNLLRHSFYNLFLKKQGALELAYRVERQKDDDLLGSSLKAIDERNLEEAKRLATEHVAHFSNSSNHQKIHRVLATVEEIERGLAFEKALNRWGAANVQLQPTTEDSAQETKTKLDNLSSLLMEVRDSKGVPLAGKLRTDWTALLDKIDTTRADLSKKIKASDLAGRIRQAIDAADYLQAADLLAGSEFQKAPDNDLLRSFQLSLGKRIQERCETLVRQGENWRDASEYAEKFLEPTRRTIVPDGVRLSIASTILSVKQKGDRYLYELARANKNNESMDRYLSAEAPPDSSMKAEIAEYRKWLQDRDTPRRLDFRMVKIQWGGSLAKGWKGSTVIKLYANGNGDARNDQADDNQRYGVTTDQNGLRVATVNNIAQTTKVAVVFQCFHIGTLGGWGDAPISSKEVKISPEDLAKDGIYDSASSRIEFQIDGVVREPFLPDWHPLM